MPLFKKALFVLLALLITGVARMPLERPLGREMRAAGILAEPLDTGTSEALGQTSAAIALGGLRSLVAATLNFSKVVTAWQNQDWLNIFNTFEQIHTLQPKTSYYWESAASYAADDAYSDYGDRSNVPDSQRALRRDEFFHKGISYLDEGIQNIPENLKLRETKARMLSDIYKPDHLDYAAATEVLDEAVKLEAKTEFIVRRRLYIMARVPERRREALKLAQEIFATPEFRFPSVKSLLFALQSEFPEEEAVPVTEIYSSESDVIRSLFNYYQRRKESLPVKNVKAQLEKLIAPLALPVALDPLQNTDIKRITLKRSELMAEFPLALSNAPMENATDWPVVVSHFQEYGSGSLSTIRVLFFVLQNISGIDSEQFIPLNKIFPNKYTQAKDLANFFLDESHNYPRTGVEELLKKTLNDDEEVKIPEHLDPLKNPSLFPLNKEWERKVTQWQFEQINQVP